jgi:hypothetical protein
MLITSRAVLLAVSMLASAPLLAAGPGTSTAGAPATTEQDNCTPPGLPPTELSPDKLASLLPKPGSTPPDPAEVDKGLRKAEACARALGIPAPGARSTTSTISKETLGPTSNGAATAQFSSPSGL